MVSNEFLIQNESDQNIKKDFCGNLLKKRILHSLFKDVKYKISTIIVISLYKFIANNLD